MKAKTWFVITLLFLLLLAAGGLALAEGGYTLNWWTVDGGGGPVLGGDYALNSTAGQPDAGALTGGDYTLAGGFWAATSGPPPPAGPTIFLPLVIRGS
ncbi:MAG: hypothetical protein L0332_20080 [Chloroflexi bacterium]|nr:hypothetical protein [Chloroflexota bacterium]MCI0577454.1 hypothetical protein [Chloroflexota bacterium]MCI0647801.1 hypothetical protein [Chloroflexota bacterium]MCI0728997.1 hypothetical protein [Chloroflexota bacterium]